MADVVVAAYGSIIDVGVHVHETAAALLPYAEMPLRRALEHSRDVPERWLDTPGYSPLTAYDPPRAEVPAPPTRTITTAAALRDALDARGVAAAIVTTGKFLLLGSARDGRYAVQASQAYNRWMQAEWIAPARGIACALLVPGQASAEAAHEIAAYGGTPGIAAVFLPVTGVSPLLGDRCYDPIYAAASAAGLPVVLDPATWIGTIFPYQLERFDTALAKQTLARPFGAIANLVSMVTSGTLSRFPALRLVVHGVGPTWLAALAGRLDQQYRFLRSETPELTEQPSTVIRRQVLVTTRGWDLPDDPSAAEASVTLLGGPDRLLFASGWPHYDADDPHRIAALALPVAWKRKILSENARRTFALPDAWTAAKQPTN